MPSTSLSSTTVVDLWFWHLDASPAELARWHTLLDATERARMARFMFPRDQRRFTICRARTRRILGWYTATDPRAVRFTTVGRGKPALASETKSKVNFNLTHTDGLACLAVTRGEPVGVDLESMRDIKDDFIAYALNPSEQASVLPLAPSDRRTAFFRVWTAKEAYLKSIGTGLWQSLKTFDVDVPQALPIGGQPVTFQRADLPRIDDAHERARDWHLFTFQPTPSHIGALAVVPAADGASVSIRPHWLTAPHTPTEWAATEDGAAHSQAPSPRPAQ